MTATDLNMDFALSEEQQALVDALVAILTDRTTMERLKERDTSESWYDLETWQELAKADILGTAITEAQGGLGYGILELCLLLEEVGRFVAPVPMLPALVASALPLARFGTPEQQAELAKVASGQLIGTAALVEFGADPEHPTTTAKADGDGWRISGEKVLVPAANVAAGILTPANVGGAVGMFFVPTDAAGVTLERQKTTSPEPHFLVRYDNVRVDDFSRLGDIEQGAEILRYTLGHTTVGLCAVAAGVADRAVRMTAEYTTTRQQFGRSIATFQLVEGRLADAYINAEAMHLSWLLAATRLTEGREAPLEIATAKYWAAEGGNFVGHAALHCHGGISIDLDYPIHRYFLWAKQLEFSLGSATKQLSTIGRALADTPA